MLGIVTIECGQVHDTLALQFTSAFVRYGKRHGAYCLDLLRHVLAHYAVATCCRADKLAVTVGNADCQSVVLQLHGKVHFAYFLVDLGNPIFQLAEALRLVKAVQTS